MACSQQARILLIVLSFSCMCGARLVRGEDMLEGWSENSPRDEIRPTFRIENEPTKSLVIEADREGLQGWWAKDFSIAGGQYYQFRVTGNALQIENSRRSAFPRILWKDDQGNIVNRDAPVIGPYHPAGAAAQSTPEYPREQHDPLPSKLLQGTSVSRAGKRNPTGVSAIEFGGTFRAPKDATRATVELHLQWANGGVVRWQNIEFLATEPPAKRLVRLATAHYRPQGHSPEKNCEEFVPIIEEAAQQKVDLLVLPETLTYFGTGRSFPECAEPIPGPATKFFGNLAKKHNMYLVVGLLERDAHIIYNVAALIGPEGELVGKYRKVCLPRGEADAGIAAGNEFPVFETRFGKVGMMVCYDGFFPEPARELTENGAEIIAFPVWGCNPLLAAARACENQVYVVSSTYTDVSQNWMVSAIFGHQGEMLAQATTWGSIAVTEVDLSQATIWAGLGDFGAEVHRHRPPSAAERVNAVLDR